MIVQLNLVIDISPQLTHTLNMNNNLLAANIAAENRVNAYIRAVVPKMFEALKPFLGQKVVLATGELSAKVKKAMEPFLGWKLAENMQIYCYSSKYSLVYTFKTSEPTGDYGCTYREHSVYFGKIESNNIMSTFFDFKPENFPEYKIEEILATRAELEAAEKKVAAIKSKLPEFAQKY